ncbi:hypothetical protein [Sphingobacterium hotanense]|uniref:Uncharacterized protein n=1 Tax=Sphingobacterium hotanense TaxID=649196 RepID=A0ABT7NJD3_9SPHI|nr:hypothetical protein [Sphingobacterium hotanense]MDM1047313.1 hypothetical protein [Sphingobacterium hotanense]
MHPVLKNILAIVLGLVAGSLVNGGIIQISSSIIAPPEGVDVMTAEGLKAGLHLFEPKHFLMPFLAHALGTLFGAFVAAKICAGPKLLYAMIIGFFFLFGGISMIFMVPSPLWFSIVDLTLAYLLMAFLGARLAK